MLDNPRGPLPSWEPLPLSPQRARTSRFTDGCREGHTGRPSETQLEGPEREDSREGASGLTPKVHQAGPLTAELVSPEQPGGAQTDTK